MAGQPPDSVRDEQARLLRDNADDLVYRAGPDRIVRWVAPTVTRTLGWTPDELVGTAMSDLVHPRDRERSEEARRVIYATGRLPEDSDGRFVLRMRTKSGAYRWMTARVTRVDLPDGTYDGLVVGMRDIHDLIAAQEAVSSTAGELNLALMSMDAAAIGMAVVAPDGRLLRVNPALARMLHHEAADLVGRRFTDITHPDDVDRGLSDVREVVAGRSDGFTERKRYLTANGGVVWADLWVSAVRESGELKRMVAQMVDVSAEVATLEQLHRSRRQLRLLAENATDVVYQTSAEGIIEWVSPSVQEVLGWIPEQLLGTPASALVAPEDRMMVDRERSQVYRGHEARHVEVGFLTADGGRRLMSASARPIRDDAGDVVGAVVGLQDLSAEGATRERLGRLLAGLNHLMRLPYTLTEQELFAAAINLAVELTGSRIGYLHYVNDDQETLELSTWSDSTAEYCTVTHDRHYPLSEAGVWADTFRRREPQVHNDFAATADQRGLPEGHAPVLRHLGVPALDGDEVRLLLGVGNKPDPYDAVDVQIAQGVVDEAWQVLSRLREHRALATEVALFHEQADELRLGTWQFDPTSSDVRWGPVAREILGQPGGRGPARGWKALSDRLDEADREHLRATLAGLEPGIGVDLELVGRDLSGGPIKLHLRGRWEQRAQGTGEHLIGSLADITLQEEAAREKHRAAHDPLTGLLNRSGLMDDLHGRLTRDRHRREDAFALLFVDLDDFKAVNDGHGHLVGDTVLRRCAERLASGVRQGDVVARFGGDEFVVLQGGGPDEREILELAHKLIARVSEPIETEVGELRVGASIGVAKGSRALPGANALLALADEALYQAKRRGVPVVIRDSVPVDSLPVVIRNPVPDPGD